MLVARLIAMLLRYGLVSAACAALNIAIIWLGTEPLGLQYPVAAAGTCLVTIPISYLLHRHVSFAVSSRADRQEFGRFVLTQLLQFAIGFVLMAACIATFKWRPWISMGVVSAVMATYGFITNYRWVFRIWRPRSPGACLTGRSSGVRLKLLQVSAFFPAHGGGIEIVAGQLAAGLASAGVDVEWIAGGTAHEVPQIAASPGLVIRHARSFDFLERSLGLPAPVWNLASLRRLWRSVGYSDIVHVHDYLYAPSLAGILFARLRRKPVVLTQHIGDIPFDAWGSRLILRTLNLTLGRWVLGGVHQVAYVGKPVQRYFGSFVSYRTPPMLIPNGVDHLVYRPDAARDEVPTTSCSETPPPLKALFVGRFVEKKGLDLLRRILPLEGIQWRFVGRGPLSPADWNIDGDTLELLGALPPFAVADAMRAADLLVLPSKGEGFPLVVQEALACGTPVLVSQEIAAAFPRIDARCVWSVDLSGAREVAATLLGRELERLSQARGELREARALAAALATQWSWDQCVASYLGLYESLSPRSVPTAKYLAGSSPASSCVSPSTADSPPL